MAHLIEYKKNINVINEVKASCRVDELKKRDNGVV